MHTHYAESAPFRLRYLYEEIHEESVVLIVCIMVRSFGHKAVKLLKGAPELAVEIFPRLPQGLLSVSRPATMLRQTSEWRHGRAHTNMFKDELKRTHYSCLMLDTRG